MTIFQASIESSKMFACSNLSVTSVNSTAEIHRFNQ
ncbi:hypothetical protein COLO4_26146 [Corchorus olitorius]|uniref:Uncharacterized protein n=1 Tax=Corchorus olitorius TaxID=93759 RepID=A0A1R3HYP3_9ROSI|nr:hypothetical protein COLO4_26146 [Corchorus olitorius]